MNNVIMNDTFSAILNRHEADDRRQADTERAQDMLKKEVHDLKLLAESCSVKIPKVLFARGADSKIPVDCYGMENNFVRGKNYGRHSPRIYLSVPKAA